MRDYGGVGLEDGEAEVFGVGYAQALQVQLYGLLEGEVDSYHREG